MKPMTIKLIGLFGIGVLLIGVEIHHGILTTSEYKDQTTLFTESVDRPSITFILGEDKPGQNYFALAEAYFLWDPQEKTDRVVTSCKSLEDLLCYLNRRSDSHPWGNIQVVVHGNVWSGLSVPMWQDGPRAYPKDLLRAVKSNRFSRIIPRAIDHQTRVNFWACGIGKNPYLNMALKRMFETDSLSNPQVYASPHFVVFARDSFGRAKRLKASYWPYFFKRGYRPSDSEIEWAFRKNFPDEKVDWHTGLSSHDIDSTGLFHKSFHVPVVWTKFYETKEDRPSVQTFAEKMKWVESEVELQRKIKMLGIPPERYHWTINKVLVTDADGQVRPAIKAIGMCTVLCVMRTEGGNLNPEPLGSSMARIWRDELYQGITLR